MLDKIEPEVLFDGSQVSLANTRQVRYTNIDFVCKKEGAELVLTSLAGELRLTIQDEIILYIITKFRFAPVWLVQQWYESQMTLLVGDASTRSKLRTMIDFGLLYEFPTAVAVFLMPTNNLAKLFGVELGAFTNPPYNTLTHTISEEQVMYDCLSGQAKYLQGIQTIPYVSSFDIGQIGSMCIPESDYSVRSKYFKDNIQEFNDQESRLAQEIIDGKLITTPDLLEFKFTIHKKLGQYDYELKIPDLSVMAVRKLDDGLALPQSVALEVELTCKGTAAYEKILDIYWSNLKFGKVVYLVNAKKTKDCVVEAFKTVRQKHTIDGESQTCALEIVEFEVPYNKEQMINK